MKSLDSSVECPEVVVYMGALTNGALERRIYLPVVPGSMISSENRVSRLLCMWERLLGVQ